MDRKLILELSRKKKLYAIWKQGQISQEFDRADVHTCRVQDAKGQSSELKLTSTVSDNKKGF